MHKIRAHGDIDPRNILFNEQNQPVLIDLDNAVSVGGPLNVGYEPYVRQRRCKEGDGLFGIASAISEQFALGSIFWLVLTGKRVYKEIPAPNMVSHLFIEIFPETTQLGRAGKIITDCWHGRFNTIADLLERLREVTRLEDTHDGEVDHSMEDLDKKTTLTEADNCSRRQEAELFHAKLMDGWVRDDVGDAQANETMEAQTAPPA